MLPGIKCTYDLISLIRPLRFLCVPQPSLPQLSRERVGQLYVRFQTVL